MITHPAQTLHSLFHRWPVRHTWSTLTHSLCTDGILTVPQMTSEPHMVHTHTIYIYIYIYPIKTQFAFDESIRDCAHVTTVVFPHNSI
jgi:hypothetical protein